MIAIEMDRKTFEPGEEVAGVVRWDQLLENERLDIRLIWYTSGKGDQDFGVEDSIAIVQPDVAGEQVFSLTAPFWPHSFSGVLVSLTWAIEVVRLPGKDAERCDLVIAPGGREIILHGKQGNGT